MKAASLLANMVLLVTIFTSQSLIIDKFVKSTQKPRTGTEGKDKTNQIVVSSQD